MGSDYQWSVGPSVRSPYGQLGSGTGARGLAIAQMLAAHPDVAWVRYPYLESDPGFAIARRQMANGSAMLSFGLRSGFEGARQMLDRLHLISRAVSLGDAESLIMHPASLTRAR